MSDPKTHRMEVSLLVWVELDGKPCYDDMDELVRTVQLSLENEYGQGAFQLGASYLPLSGDSLKEPASG